MSLSSVEQQNIQNAIDASGPEQRQEMRFHAEATLLQYNTLMGHKWTSHDESKAAEIAIEILTRIEATEKGKGWWFRTKRRVQLTQMYLGN